MSDFHALDHAAIEELLGAYALDAVDASERDQIEAHLVTCPRCRAEVADSREVAALLAHGGAPAPEGVWDRIRSSLEEPPPRLRLAVEPSNVVALPRRRALRFGAAVAAVAAAVVIAVLGVEVAHLSTRIDHMRDSASLAAAAGRALSDPTARQASLKTSTGATEARAVVTGSGQGYLLASGLPALDGRVYQLWGQTGDQVVSLGVMGARPDVVAFTVNPDVARIMITAEDAPVQQTRNTPVVIGTVT